MEPVPATIIIPVIHLGHGAEPVYAYHSRVNIPPGMQLAFQGKAGFIREVMQQLKGAGIEHTTGPLPGG